MAPFQQGNLDSLCGVYSVVNAVSLIKNLPKEEAQELYGEIVEYLQKSHNLAGIATGGMTVNVLGGILKHVIGGEIERKMPFRRRPSVPLAEFWREIQEFSKEEQQVVLLRLSGTHEHWTLVDDISDKRINLRDSVQLKILNRNHCTTGRKTSRRMHILVPQQSYFLSL